MLMRIFQVDLYIGYPLNLLGGKQETGNKSLKHFFYVTYWIGNFIISETFQILLILNLITSSVKKKMILNYICLTHSYFQPFNSRLW